MKKYQKVLLCSRNFPGSGYVADRRRRMLKRGKRRPDVSRLLTSREGINTIGPTS